MAKTFTRKELYELVWSTPMKTLAASFGLSDVGLAKTCRNADIPLPERGYWAKCQAGKRTVKRELPPRFPGVSDEITIGGYGGYEQPNPDDPLPPPPVFEEEMTAVTTRVRRMVGRVTCPLLTSPHRLVAKLLAQDDAIRAENLRHGYSWLKPQYDTPEAKRQLRIINALFTAAYKIGCTTSMSTSKYTQDRRKPSINVGGESIAINLAPITGKAVRQDAQGSPRLQLSLSSYMGETVVFGTWEDNENTKIEDHLTEIFVSAMVAGETVYRQRALWHHDWIIKRRAEILEERKRKAEEEIQKERERREQEERERIERLLAQADALQKATTIRAYVEAVCERSSEIGVVPGELLRWAEWARGEANRIDPVLNGQVESEAHRLGDTVN